MILTKWLFCRRALTLWLTFMSGFIVVTASPAAPAVAATLSAWRETAVGMPTIMSPPDASPPIILLVGNTGGQGVYLRATPNMADKLNAWRDGSPMRVLGGLIDPSGAVWFNVQAPDGQTGWIPEAFLVPPDPPPTLVPATPTAAPPTSMPTPTAVPATSTPTAVPATSTPTAMALPLVGPSQFSREGIMLVAAHGTNNDVLALLGPPVEILGPSSTGMELWFYQVRSYDSATGRVDPWLRIVVNGRTGQVVEINFYAAAT